MDEKSQSSAAAAGKQVQAIIEAAEATAQAIREQAERDAAEHVTRARQMVELLAGGAEQLKAEIDDVVVRVDGLKAAIDAVRVDLVAAEHDVTESHVSGATPVRPIEPEPEPDPEPAAQEPVAPVSTAPEGARLIALNMALSGKPREETARYLRENMDLQDQDDLLDEVYAKAGS